MQRRFRLPFTILLMMICGALAFAQETTRYKDVLLDGMPAKLNLNTGEIILVSELNQKKLAQNDSILVRRPVVNDSITVSLESDFHTVKEKETLLDIANRYNTTLTELKRINNLETTLVNQGQIIRVREIDLGTEDDVIEVVEVTPEDIPESKPDEAVSPSGLSVYTKSSTEFHVVEEGQTLYSLAKLYGLTVDELKQFNGLTSNLIMVGQELRVVNAESQLDKDSWTVSKGDTLYNISKRNGLTVEELKRLNGLTSNLIKIGQILRLK